VKISDRQHVGDIERLRDIALSLNLAHAQRIAANVAGALRKRGRVGKRFCGIHFSLLRGAQ